MFYCKNCKSEVKAGQAQCPVCGADVVENYVVICPACNSHVQGGSRFCPTCGAMLPMIKKPVCVICGTQNVPGAKFCCSCGGPMLMNEDTHSLEDIIEQRKQKMRNDLLEKERIKAVDDEIARRRKNVEAEEQKSKEKILRREKECNEYINEKAVKLDRFRKIIEEAEAPDSTKLKNLVKGIRNFSQFLSAPFAGLSDAEKDEAVFICPVCGAENSLSANFCYACGRDKQRSLKLLGRGILKKMPNFGSMNKKPVSYQKVDFSDPEDVAFEEVEDDSVSPDFENEDRNGLLEKNAPQNVQSGNAAENGYGEAARRDYSQSASQPPQGYPMNGAPFMVAPAFYGTKQDSREIYQMPPIVQPVAFVPYVTQDQPVLQYAEGNEILKKGEKNERGNS